MFSAVVVGSHGGMGGPGDLLFFHSFSFFHYLIGPTSCAYAKPAQVGTLCTCYVPVPLGDDGGAQKVRMIPGASCLAPALQPPASRPVSVSLTSWYLSSVRPGAVTAISRFDAGAFTGWIIA